MTHPVSSYPNKGAYTIAPRWALSYSEPVSKSAKLLQHILVDGVVHVVAPPLSLNRPDAFQHP